MLVMGAGGRRMVTDMGQMKRLTYKSSRGGWTSRKTFKTVCGRLATLEDIIFAADGTPRLTLERLSELTQADAEGRCVVKPRCKDCEFAESTNARCFRCLGSQQLEPDRSVLCAQAEAAMEG